jgi:hypothetical protein
MAVIAKNVPMLYAWTQTYVYAQPFSARFAFKVRLCMASIQLTAGLIRCCVLAYTLYCQLIHKYTRGHSALIRRPFARPFYHPRKLDARSYLARLLAATTELRMNCVRQGFAA